MINSILWEISHDLQKAVSHVRSVWDSKAHYLPVFIFEMTQYSLQYFTAFGLHHSTSVSSAYAGNKTSLSWWNLPQCIIIKIRIAYHYYNNHTECVSIVLRRAKQYFSNITVGDTRKKCALHNVPIFGTESGSSALNANALTTKLPLHLYNDSNNDNECDYENPCLWKQLTYLNR